MKKFLMVSALAILCPSYTTAHNRGDHLSTAVGVGALLLIGYGGYRYFNAPANNPSSAPKEPQQQEQHNEPALDKLLHGPQPSDPALHKTENNNSPKEPKPEKPQAHNSIILPSKLTLESDSSSSNIKPVMLQKQSSFSEALYQRFRQPETEKHLEKLLTDHAFSD